jgi:hypothetical protein
MEAKGFLSFPSGDVTAVQELLWHRAGRLGKDFFI